MEISYCMKCRSKVMPTAQSTCPSCNGPLASVTVNQIATYEAENQATTRGQKAKFTSAQRKKRAILSAMLLLLLCVILGSATLEPFCPLESGGNLEFRHAPADGDFHTRTTVDDAGDIVCVETVHLSYLRNGGRGPVDGILKKTVYGKRIWGGASVPIITYDARRQSVTIHKIFGERTFGFASFVSLPQAGFEINAAGQILATGTDAKGDQHGFSGTGTTLRHTVNGVARTVVCGSGNWLVGLMSMLKR